LIPVNSPLLGQREKELLAECIESGWISSEGPFVAQFEEGLAQTIGRKYGIAVCNGTAALGIGPGDEVIVPTFTIISCVQQIVRCGARPVFVDCCPDTWNMRVDQVEERISPRTKAIMAVHIFGLPVDMDPLMELAEHYNLAVIEDAAEMLGQTYKGRQCGSFGTLSTFSFYPNKLVTTGEGGMAVTDDYDLAERCRSLRNLCFQPGKRFVHEELGWNYRMTNLQAALGIAQLEKLEQAILRKREIGRYYNKALRDLPGVQLPLEQCDYAQNIYWVFGLVLKESLPFDAVKAMQDLAEKGIGTRPFFWPMHKQPVLKKSGLAGSGSFPAAERLADRGFYVPCGLGLSDNELTNVAEAVIEVLG